MEEQNRVFLKNQEDVNPTSQQDQIAKQNDLESIPETNGTGSNKPVPTAGSVIIKDDENKQEEKQENGNTKNKDED